MTTQDSHINALRLRLSNEKCRLSSAKTKHEREMREVWVKGIEKEIKGEQRFLESNKINDSIDVMNDDELLAALGA